MLMDRIYEVMMEHLKNVTPAQLERELEDVGILDCPDKCKSFGHVDGMNGSCHYCNAEDHELFNACWDERFKGTKAKI